MGKKSSMRNVTIGEHDLRPGLRLQPARADLEERHARPCPGTCRVQQFPSIDPSVVQGFTTKVPDVTGLTAAKALQTLADAGFTPLLAPKPVDSLLPAGIVVRTNPTGGSSVGTGSTITVYVSSGKPPPGPVDQPAVPDRSATPPPPGGGGGGGAPVAAALRRWDRGLAGLRSQAELPAHLGRHPAALGAAGDLRP